MQAEFSVRFTSVFQHFGTYYSFRAGPFLQQLEYQHGVLQYVTRRRESFGREKKANRT